MDRRRFVWSLLVAPGVAAATTSASHASALSEALHGAKASAAGAASMSSSAGGVAALLVDPVPSADGICAGLELAGGFTVVRAFDVFHGALPVVVEGEGQRFQLDVVRPSSGTSPGTRGVFTTANVDVFVHGRGGETEERGARALGLALQRRIDAGAALPALASFDERQAQVGSAFLNVDFVRMDHLAR